MSFARSGIAAHWNASAYQSILELCRTGVCHSCESGLVSGAVVYGREPLDKPADGNVLVCCSLLDEDPLPAREQLKRYFAGPKIRMDERTIPPAPFLPGRPLRVDGTVWDQRAT